VPNDELSEIMDKDKSSLESVRIYNNSFKFTLKFVKKYEINLKFLVSYALTKLGETTYKQFFEY